MKIRYLITGLALGLLGFAGCAEPDDLTRTGSDVDNLVMSATSYPLDALNTQYPGVVDFDAGTITIQVPWFISDTEEIQLDLESMKLTATMPLGAKFEPGLAGIHDMAAGIQRTLVYEDGRKIPLTIKAEYIKSERKQVTKVSFQDLPNAVVAFREPASAGGDATIVVFRVGSSMEFMQKATLAVSPWATYSVSPASAKNPDGTYDLSGDPTITVTSQNGTTQKYKMAIEEPSFVPSGQIGYKSVLFGFQTTVQNPHGLVAGKNRSLAVVGEYLVVGSTELKFPVFNRFTGELLTGVQVNTTGLLNGFVHAITNDDAGHMVAITYTANNKTDGGDNKIFEVYVWKNGITSAPMKVFTGDVTGDSFAAWRAKNNALSNANAWEIGRVVSVKGDITSGKALLMSFANAMAGSALILRMEFTDGVPANPTGSIRGLFSWGVRTKPIPLALTDPIEGVFIAATGNFRMNTVYTPETTGANIVMNPIPSGWTTANIGLGYMEFNGLKLVGIQNVLGSDNPLSVQYARLYVGDITTLAATSLTDGKIMDSRLDNYDPMRGPMGPGLGNASITGMTSNVPVVGGETILGPNHEPALMNATVAVGATGDVCFGRSDDGNAVQVYMLTTDNGIIAYELTRYDL